MAAIFGRRKIFGNWVSYSEVPCESKILLKSLSSTVFETQGFLCFAFLKKNSTIQNGHHFWQVKYLLKLAKASLHRHPVGQKFCQNPKIIFYYYFRMPKFIFYEENCFKKYLYISIVLYVKKRFENWRE